MTLKPISIDNIVISKSIKPVKSAKSAKIVELKMNLPFVFQDTCNRSMLSEGRNTGMGFAFCKREGNLIKTVQPLSPCKDYLNDVVYSEQTGDPFVAHGLSTFKQNIFDTNAYLVFGILGRIGGGTYDNYDRDFNLLKNNVKELQEFINQWETILKVEGRTQLVRLQENRVLGIVPLFWAQYTYLISLYSLLLRVGLHYKNGNVVEFLKTCQDDRADSRVIGYCRDKIDKLVNGERPVQNWDYFSHGMGLSGFKF